MRNPNPNCTGECRFTLGMSTQTMVYYPPVYDKSGVNLNPDGNTTRGTVACGTCGKRWSSSTQYGETTFEELVDPVTLTTDVAGEIVWGEQ